MIDYLFKKLKVDVNQYTFPTIDRLPPPLARSFGE